MGIHEGEVWLEWKGGLRTAIHESQIGEDELADMENAAVHDGSCRLDQRYIRKAQLGDAAAACQGSGWGKFESGAQSEQYAVILDSSVYLVDLSGSGDLSFTPVIGGSGLAAGDWFFSQFERHLYVAGASGLYRKKLAPGVDGTGDWSRVARPSRPGSAPGSQFVLPTFITADFTGATISNTGLTSAVFSGGRIVCRSDSAGVKSLLVQFTTSPDRRIDAEYRDVLSQPWAGVGDMGPVFRIFEREGSNEYELITWRQEFGVNRYRLHNVARSNRNQITHIRYEWEAPAGTTYVYVWPPMFHGVWLSLPTTHDPGVGLPVLQKLAYAQTYFNDATQLEGPPSPLKEVAASSQNPFGNWLDLTLTPTGEAGVSHIRVYRVVEQGSVTTYYRLAQVSNAGSPTHRDKLPLDEVEGLPTYVPATLPEADLTALGTWQDRLVLAVGSQVYVSRNDDELAFEDPEGATDEFDEGRGLTFYPDDRHAERVRGLGSAEALYVVMDYSVRCLFGTGPGNWRLVKLMDEGAVGARAWTVYGDGVLVLTPSGRLMYCALGRAPDEVSDALRARIGNAGLKSLARADAVVGLRPDGQIEVRDGTGRYVVMDWEGGWRKGTHTHPSHSLLFVSGRPIRWMGANGKLYEGGDDSFETDGGTSGTNGEEVEGFVLSREYLLPRVSVQNVFWGRTQETLAEDGSIRYPRIEHITTRRSQSYAKRAGKRNVRGSIKDSGWSYQAKLVFGRGTVITDCRVRLAGLSEARHQ